MGGHRCNDDTKRRGAKVVKATKVVNDGSEGSNGEKRGHRSNLCVPR